MVIRTSWLINGALVYSENKCPRHIHIGGARKVRNSKKFQVETTYAISSIEPNTGTTVTPLYVSVQEQSICGRPISSKDHLVGVHLQCKK